MDKILVLDAAQRSALAVTRSLGKLANTQVFCSDTSTHALAGESKYCEKYLPSPDPICDPESYLAWLSDIIEQEDISHLFPVTEVSSRLILSNPELRGKVKIPFAELETVLSLSDKNRLMALAEELDVPIPRTAYFANASEVDVSNLSYPIVVKPSLSRVLVEGQWVTTQVTIAQDQAHLTSILESNAHYAFSPFMLQEFIDGHGEGVFCYYQNGQAIAYFAHERIREKPPEGGVSVLSASRPVAKALKEHADKLLTAVKWHGVAMVEYRIDKQGNPYLMEINTRFWGSLQLSIDAGVNFPQLAYLGENSELKPQQENYQVDVQLRWLLGDLDSLYLFLKSKKYSFKEKMLRVLGFLTPRSNRNMEVNRLDDLAPAWYELKQYMRAFFQ